VVPLGFSEPPVFLEPPEPLSEPSFSKFCQGKFFRRAKMFPLLAQLLCPLSDNPEKAYLEVVLEVPLLVEPVSNLLFIPLCSSRKHVALPGQKEGKFSEPECNFHVSHDLDSPPQSLEISFLKKINSGFSGPLQVQGLQLDNSQPPSIKNSSFNLSCHLLVLDLVAPYHPILKTFLLQPSQIIDTKLSVCLPF
jgi:hypothetical protein